MLNGELLDSASRPSRLELQGRSNDRTLAGTTQPYANPLFASTDFKGHSRRNLKLNQEVGKASPMEASHIDIGILTHEKLRFLHGGR